MAKFPTLLEQFRSFCFQNNATDFEEAVKYFAVFGGMGWTVDMSKSLDELIEEKVLKNYRFIHGDIAKITQSNQTHHALLSALAVGDRREFSAFKRADAVREDGKASIKFLIDNGLLIRDISQDQPVDENEVVSNKLHFTLPFMRFWFSSISPYYKGIKEGDFAEVKERWGHLQYEFNDLIYDQLVMELVKLDFPNDPVEKIGSYWDKKIDIDILARTKSGKVVAGACKYSKAKANKNELTKLKEKCEQAQIDVNVFVIFSKSGFSSELKKEKGEAVRLMSLKNHSYLIDNLKPKVDLDNPTKKY